MRLHGICLVKNEEDIIALALTENLRWFDAIYVFDNGSEDRTWEIVKALAAGDARIVAYRSEARPFRDALRGEVFNAFRDRAQPGDWWCRLDGDEIYPENPKTFLSGVPTYHHAVWSLSLQYVFTHEDARRWELLPTDTSLTLGVLPHYYQCNWSELRFFRHRDRLVWDDSSWPRHVGVVHPRRIPLRHYQYRSPAQIQKRLETRRLAAAQGYLTFAHSLEADWREKITDASGCQDDQNQGTLQVDESTLPRHLESKPVRLLKTALHLTGIYP